MSVTSDRSVVGVLAGDVHMTFTLAAAENTASPGAETVGSLIIGDSTFVVPAGATAVTIVKPSGNTATITLKGAGGDTGIALHPTDPDSISLKSTQTSVILHSSAVVTVRVIWT